MIDDIYPTDRNKNIANNRDKPGRIWKLDFQIPINPEANGIKGQVALQWHPDPPEDGGYLYVDVMKHHRQEQERDRESSKKVYADRMVKFFPDLLGIF